MTIRPAWTLGLSRADMLMLRYIRLSSKKARRKAPLIVVGLPMSSSSGSAEVITDSMAS